MLNNTTYYVGIDGGGSKCSAKLFDEHKKLIGQGISGSANASRDFKKTLYSIVDSVQLALQDAQLDLSFMPHLHVGAGLAGACVPNINLQLKTWQHPFASFHVESDLITSFYGAFGDADGAILIVGTGSSAAKMQGQHFTQYGGHGFLLGDKGSGAWFGREAVSSTLNALDAVIPMTELHQMVLNKLAVNDGAALVQAMLSASPSEFALLAPDVIEMADQGEPLATALVKDGANYLNTLCNLALQDNSLPLVLMGGLSAAIRPWLSDELRRRIVTALACPETGAMYLVNNPEVVGRHVMHSSAQQFNSFTGHPT